MDATQGAAQSAEQDRKAVAALDTEYQAAVGRNDAATMACIHHENMIWGDTAVVTRSEERRVGKECRL